MMRRILCLLVLVACGGADKPPAKSAAQPPEDPKYKERRALNDAEPKVPYELARSSVFALKVDCGQGPFRADVEPLEADFGESDEVYVCAAHAVSGRERFTEGDNPPWNDGYHFGDDKPDNARCRSADAEAALASRSSVDAGAPHTTPRPQDGASAQGKTKTPPPAPLAEDKTVKVAAYQCPAGLFPYTAAGEIYRNRPSGKIHVEIWSEEPNDLRGAFLVVQQYGAPKNMTAERWKKLQDDYDAWRDKLEAFRKQHAEMYTVDDKGVPPPPAAKTETQPPKPSQNAEWVPGYWHRVGSDWAWIAGLWRVPEEDVKKELTQVAPAAPPPVKNETAAQAVVVTRPPDAVWTNGNWQWDGARWVWVEGAWRPPPRRGAVWVTPSWRMGRRGFTFVPGGWH